MTITAIFISSTGCMKKELDDVMIMSPGSANMYTEALAKQHVDGLDVTHEEIRFEGSHMYLYRAGAGMNGCTLSRTRLTQDSNGFSFIELDSQTEVCQAYQKCSDCQFKGAEWGDGCICASDPYVKTKVLLLSNKGLVAEWSYETR